MKNRVDIYDIACTLGLLAFLGFLLVVFRGPLTEGFTSGDAVQCHADSPCPGHLKCINGFCAKTDPRALYVNDSLPMLPKGESYPFSTF
jgi:hypothetical protein